MNILNSILVTNLVLWAIFGFFVGLVVHIIDPGDVSGGIVGTTILGILGAVVGGFLATLVFGTITMGFTVQAFAIAVGGGLFLALIHRLFFRNEGHIRTTTRNLQ